MSKLINRPEDVVGEHLEGLAALNPAVCLLRPQRVVVRRDAPVPGRVAIVSGGGSGHEPAHAGYVGKGMLSAAVAGEVFTSPSAEAVLEAIRAVDSGAGVLLLIKNYTGDRLHFGQASEQARSEGRHVTTVVVGDDAAFSPSMPRAERRGIAGTVLVHKIAGAAAEAGLPLHEVTRVAARAAQQVSSVGVALGAATLPGAKTAGFELAPGTVALGLGIHGEPGVQDHALESCDVLVAQLFDRIAQDKPIRAGEHVAILINGLGATPPMELTIVARAVLSHLHQLGCVVERAYVGSFLTALDMAGVSISVLRNADDQTIALLDSDTDAPAWPRSANLRPSPGELTGNAVTQRRTGKQLDAGSAGVRVLTAVVEALEAAESELGELDRVAGDGDLGTAFARMVRAVTSEMLDLSGANPSSLFGRLAHLASERMAGTSGALYAAGLKAAAERLGPARDNPRPTGQDWSAAFTAGVDAIQQDGGAAPGDRTMLDALRPAATAFSCSIDAGGTTREALQAAADAAEAGAVQTATLVARKGRAAHLGDRAIGYADAGAHAVAVWIRAIDQALRP